MLLFATGEQMFHVLFTVGTGQDWANETLLAKIATVRTAEKRDDTSRAPGRNGCNKQ
jgi:hypothetical protein